MYYAAGAFKKRWLENSHLKCSCNIKARVGGKLNGTEINNGRLDVFANWDLWHSGSKGLRQAKPFEEFCCVGVVRYNNMLCSQTNTYTLRTWEFFIFFNTEYSSKHVQHWFQVENSGNVTLSWIREGGKAVFDTQRAEMSLIKRFSQLGKKKKEKPCMSDSILTILSCCAHKNISAPPKACLAAAKKPDQH